MTGGLFGFLVTREEGAGDAFRGSLVTYQTEAKRMLLDVDEREVVSAGAAESMAKAALKRLETDIAISITGVAGPETQEGKPVGTVFIGTASVENPVSSSRFQFAGDPDEIRYQAATEAARRALAQLDA
jgi:PncC family amidohydrolase